MPSHIIDSLPPVHGFTNEAGYRLEISTSNLPSHFVVSVRTAPGHRLFLPADQAPAVALAI